MGLMLVKVPEREGDFERDCERNFVGSAFLWEMRYSEKGKMKEGIFSRTSRGYFLKFGSTCGSNMK